jgi:hypothetical protein
MLNKKLTMVEILTPKQSNTHSFKYHFPDMNKNIYISFIVSIFLLSFTACEKEINDQLKGKWQLKTIEEAGRITSVDTVWYNFQSESLFMYQIYQPAIDTYLHTYGYKIQPESHIIQLEIISWTILKEDFLPFTDWTEPVRTFAVDKITRRQLILKSDNKTYTFDRF